MAKPTFKNDKRPQGLASVGFVAGSDIKIEKKIVGRIHPPSRFGGVRKGYEVWLMTNKREHEDCHWSWLAYSRNHKTLDEAKQSVRDSWKEISGLDLRSAEDQS